MPSAPNRKRFSWLHFSDFHVVAHDEERLAGAQWKALLADLAALHDESGPWDAVFLAGDLTVAGQSPGFKTFNTLLEDMLGNILLLGSLPSILIVPGNHDALWPELPSELPLLFKYASTDADARRILRERSEQIDNLVKAAFASYEDWRLRAQNTIHFLQSVESRRTASGAFSTSFGAQGVRVGVVGLNTATRHLVGGDFKGRLMLDLQQLAEVCGPDPDEWARPHDFTILLTHHPPSWFEPDSRTAFLAEVAPPGRFSLHLCGSMSDETQLVRLQESPSLLVQSPTALGVETSLAPGYVAGSVEFDSGAPVLTLRPRRYDAARATYIPDPSYDPDILDEYRPSLLRSTTRRKPAPSQPAAADGAAPLALERLELKDFRSFGRFSLDFDHDSSLTGSWTCLAGINGAGKSSVLQALCLLLLGEPCIYELGGDRLERMRRWSGEGREDAELRAWLREGGRRHFLELRLTDEPLASSREAEGYRGTMLDFWRRMRSRVFLAYGATRNLSDYRDTRYSNMTPDARRLMTVFDPLTQVASAETLLEDSLSPRTPFLGIFSDLIGEVFAGELALGWRGDHFVFTGRDEVVEALDLPDGFRSSVAWLADLCAVWCEKFPERAQSATPKDIEAIVLIDEIDLHLHPSLQRVLVPRLRAALPRVQWVVTTHSPLILSSFDSAEIVALDRREPGGVRFLDRQILGFTTDQIYDWLMETPPSSAVMEEKLARRGAGPGAADDELARLIEMSPDVNAAEAAERLRRQREMIERLKSLNP